MVVIARLPIDPTERTQGRVVLDGRFSKLSVND
jgi:hypothetical protein